MRLLLLTPLEDSRMMRTLLPRLREMLFAVIFLSPVSLRFL